MFPNIRVPIATVLHDLPQSKVCSFIGAVGGQDVLHTIVTELENEPGRVDVPVTEDRRG